MMQTLLNPDQWLVSTERALTDYLKNGVDNFVLQGVTPVGLQAYDLRFDFPDSNQLPEDAELDKTIIHFMIDNIDNTKLGFGEDIVREIITVAADPDVDPDVIESWEAQVHRINYDVGIWASDQSGGVTSRLVAYQMVWSLLNGDRARQTLSKDTGGIEIVEQFDGGRFIQSTLGDVRVFRVVDGAFAVRVFSRKVLTDSGIYVREIVQDPALTISPEGSL